MLIFAATFLVLAVGRLPGLRIDRSGAAIIGACLMLAANVLTVQEAYAAIDYDTIMLLFGMMIGSLSRIPYRTFAAALAPVAAVGLVLTIAAIALVYRGEFRQASQLPMEHRRVRVDKLLMFKSLGVAGAMIILFFAGWPAPKVAVIAGALLLITRRVNPQKTYRQIDWSLLVMFIGLFIVIAGFEKTHLAADLFAWVSRYHLERPAPLTLFAAVLSNLVSNVPAVMLFKSFIPRLADPARAWLVLAASSTLAGNLTVLGSVANLIVIGRSRSQVRISFWEYAKAGVPLALATLALALWLL